MNHEYADDGLLHSDGMATWTAEKVRKSQAAHGVSVIEVEQTGRPVGGGAALALGAPHHRQHADGVRRPGRRPRAAADRRRPERAGACWARSTTAPAASRPGAPTSPAKRTSSSTSRAPTRPTPHEARWGLRKGDPVGYRWHELDERFDATQAPERAQPLRLGGRDRPATTRACTPVKRTALGRAAHEGATVAVTQGRPRGGLHGRGRALRVHLQVRQPRRASSPAAIAPTPTLLDHGTLYVARFDADGRGRWLRADARPGPADRGQRLRRPGRGADQDAPGQRPARRHQDGPPRVDRRRHATAGSTARSPTTATAAATSSPASTRPTRAPTTRMGHIIRWKEDGDFDGAALRSGTTSCWPATRPTSAPRRRATSRATPSAAPTACGSTAAACCGSRPTCRTSAMGKGDLARLGNN